MTRQEHSDLPAGARQAGPAEASPELKWIDIRDFRIEGRGWDDTESFYDRLPARAKGVVPEGVWNLASRSAGMAARFVTDATRIWARWALRRKELAMTHMPATGVSGLDLYCKDRGVWRWIGVGRPAALPTNEVALVQDLEADQREYRLYLPLYNGVESVQVGLPTDASVHAPQKDRDKPIVFYGTSIVQGGCASRPGMAYPAILGRRLHREHVNLGFSGNGRMEKELAELIAELDAAACVLDALPNMVEPHVTERTAPFVRTIRRQRPTTPIVLVENITYTNASLVAARRRRCTASNAAYRRAYESLLAEGVGGLHYVGGEELLGRDGEATVDGTHPTDVGFLRIAHVLELVLRRVI